MKVMKGAGFIISQLQLSLNGSMTRVSNALVNGAFDS